MAVVNGNDVGIYVDNQIIGCLTSNNVDLERALIETTCKDNDGARSVQTAGISGSIAFEGNFNPASTYGLEELYTIFLNGTRVGVKQSVPGSGGLYVQGYAYLRNVSWGGAVNAPSTYSGTFEFDGPITKGTGT
jgi:hypothetical protein